MVEALALGWIWGTFEDFGKISTCHALPENLYMVVQVDFTPKTYLFYNLFDRCHKVKIGRDLSNSVQNNTLISDAESPWNTLNDVIS